MESVSLKSLNWNYEDLQSVQRALLKTAVRNSKTTAQSIADSLDTQCTALHEMSYEISGINSKEQIHESASLGIRRRKTASGKEALAQLKLGHTTSLRVTLSAQFAVAPFSECDQ